MDNNKQTLSTIEADPGTVKSAAQTRVVASNKTRSWSKKEKLALSIAGMFALVGIGLGGFTFYHQVIANAAGEDSLGSDVVVDLPAANESAYFKIKWTARQDIGIETLGEARLSSSSGTSSGNFIASDWRIQQTSDPTDENSWFVVAYNDGKGDCGGTSTLQLPTNYSMFTNAAKCGRPDKYTISEDKVFQAGHDYYFRAQKRTTAQDASGQSVVSWTTQGNTVQTRTLSYPSATVTNDGNQVKLSWTGIDKNSAYDVPANSDTTLRLAFVSTGKASDLSDSAKRWRAGGISSSDDNDGVIFKLGEEATKAIQNGYLTPGTLIITQPKASTRYYAFVLYKDVYENSAWKSVIQKVVSGPQVIATDTKDGGSLASVAISPLTVRADQLGTVKVTATLNAVPNQWSVDASLPLVYSLSSGKTYTQSQLGTAYKGESPYPSAYEFGLTTGWLKPTTEDIVPGTYTITTTVRNFPVVIQTIKTPITITKVPTNISATYKDATVSYKKNVVITIQNPYVANYTFVPSGKIKIVNLNTGKTLKTVDLDNKSISKKVTLKGVKKGTYKLAVVYTATTKPGIFEDKTINLPVLTIN